MAYTMETGDTLYSNELTTGQYTISQPQTGYVDWQSMDITGTLITSSPPILWEWKFFGDDQFVIKLTREINWWQRTMTRLMFNSKWIRVRSELGQLIERTVKERQSDGELLP